MYTLSSFIQPLLLLQQVIALRGGWGFAKVLVLNEKAVLIIPNLNKLAINLWNFLSTLPVTSGLEKEPSPPSL